MSAVTAVQVKVEEMETPIELPEKPQVLLSAVKQEEAEQEVGPRHSEPKQSQPEGRKMIGSETAQVKGEESHTTNRSVEWSENQRPKPALEDLSSLDEMWRSNTEHEQLK